MSIQKYLGIGVAILLAALSFVLDGLLKLGGMEDRLLTVGAVGNLGKKIRINTALGYEGRALAKGDEVDVGRGKDAIDPDTAEAWVRAGLALNMDPMDVPGAPAAIATTVVVHERGGQELLQSMTSVQKGGKRKGPAEENPTDSDLKTDTAAGASRTAAGAVIEENADHHTVLGGKGQPEAGAPAAAAPKKNAGASE